MSRKVTPEIQAVLDALNAERYGPSLWWKTPERDGSSAAAYRRLLLMESWDEDDVDEEPNPLISKGIARLHAIESETKRGPDRANESDPLATVSTTAKGA